MLQVVSIVTALISISLALASTSRSVALNNHELDSPILRWSYISIRIIISLLMVGSRAAAAVLATTYLQAYILVFILVHTIIYMFIISISVFLQEESCFNSLLTAVPYSVYCLIGIDINSISSGYDDNEAVKCFRWTNHLLIVVSNAVLLMCWYMLHGYHQSQGYIILITVLTTTSAGFLLDVALWHRTWLADFCRWELHD